MAKKSVVVTHPNKTSFMKYLPQVNAWCDEVDACQYCQHQEQCEAEYERLQGDRK